MCRNMGHMKSGVFWLIMTMALVIVNFYIVDVIDSLALHISAIGTLVIANIYIAVGTNGY